jgi:hypothetical protein
MIMVPTSSEPELQGNNIGIGLLPTHEFDRCHADFNMSCVELAVDETHHLF